jgi:hypothetical protein
MWNTIMHNAGRGGKGEGVCAGLGLFIRTNAEGGLSGLCSQHQRQFVGLYAPVSTATPPPQTLPHEPTRQVY